MRVACRNIVLVHLCLHLLHSYCLAQILRLHCLAQMAGAVRDSHHHISEHSGQIFLVTVIGSPEGRSGSVCLVTTGWIRAHGAYITGSGPAMVCHLTCNSILLTH